MSYDILVSFPVYTWNNGKSGPKLYFTSSTTRRLQISVIGCSVAVPHSYWSTTCRNYLLIVKAWKQRTKIRMGRLPFFVSADIQLIFFINNTDVTEWTTLLYVLWFIIISIFRRSESVLLICRYYHWDHG